MSWNMQFLNFFLHAYDEVTVSDPLMALVWVVKDLIITIEKLNYVTMFLRILNCENFFHLIWTLIYEMK